MPIQTTVFRVAYLLLALMLACGTQPLIINFQPTIVVPDGNTQVMEGQTLTLSQPLPAGKNGESQTKTVSVQGTTSPTPFVVGNLTLNSYLFDFSGQAVTVGTQKVGLSTLPEGMGYKLVDGHGDAVSQVEIQATNETQAPIWYLVPEAGSDYCQQNPGGLGCPCEEGECAAPFTCQGEGYCLPPATGGDGDSTDTMGTTMDGTDTMGSTDSGSTDSGSTDSGSTDSGSTDSGSTDSGSTDSGSTDSGSTDSGSTDSGSTDSGSTDSGSTDSGSTDGGSPCEECIAGEECIADACVPIEPCSLEQPACNEELWICNADQGFCTPVQNGDLCLIKGTAWTFAMGSNLTVLTLTAAHLGTWNGAACEPMTPTELADASIEVPPALQNLLLANGLQMTFLIANMGVPNIFGSIYLVYLNGQGDQTVMPIEGLLSTGEVFPTP